MRAIRVAVVRARADATDSQRAAPRFLAGRTSHPKGRSCCTPRRRILDRLPLHVPVSGGEATLHDTILSCPRGAVMGIVVRCVVHPVNGGLVRLPGSGWALLVSSKEGKVKRLIYS